jgi:hypothetical protein
MNHRDNGDYHAFDDGLKNETNGNEDTTTLVLSHIIPRCCIFCCACHGDTFYRSTGVHENDEDAVGVEHGVHRKVVHQSTDDVICGSGVNRRSEVDEDSLCDVEIHIVGMIAAEASQDPAYREE